MAKELTPVEAFLAPLAKITRKHRDIEGLVFWGGAEGWDPSPSEALEAEEIVFYAEGLLIDGFHMDWALVLEGAAVDHLRLCFWQDGEPPPPVAVPWTVGDAGRWQAP
ncbi:hypothetical protein [Tabrizicola thermarum]|uniref:hypothetical protein n=1 Tax=Tabrizicola thermarum TaxID=2670345 RepID=UPI000FFB912F|nr:hypothetical protein [Tabrizicola thermarum]